jgi:hypothetical protein
MAQTRTLEVIIAGDSKGLSKTFDTASGDAKSFTGKVQNALGSIPVPVAAAAAAGVVIVTGVLSDAYDAALESQRISRETERVIETTGAAAWVTSDQVSGLADSLSKLDGIDDEKIQGVENLLLTFTEVQNKLGDGNDIFDQATGLALDMSTALGTDATDSAMQLGKALNDPIAGITALRRAGVSFTDDQEAQIKALAESGDLLGAQKIILGEVGKEFGGAAEAAATPMDKLNVILGNLQETVGGYLIPVMETLTQWLVDHLPSAIEWVQQRLEDLHPWFQAIADAAAAVTNWFSEHEGVLQAIGIFFGVILVAALVATAVFLGLIIVPIVAVGVALWALWVGAKWVWDHIYMAVEWFVNWLTGSAWPAISGFFRSVADAATNMWQWVSNAWTNVTNAVATAANWLSSVGSSMWNGIREGFRSAINWIIDRWNNLSFSTPDIPGTDFGGQDIDFPNIPRLHSGGMFRAPAGSGGEGLALLRDGERVLTPGQQGGQTIIVQGHLVLEKDLMRIMAQAQAQGYRSPYVTTS